MNGARILSFRREEASVKTEDKTRGLEADHPLRALFYNLTRLHDRSVASSTHLNATSCQMEPVGWTSSLYVTHFFLFEILRKNTGFGNNGRTTGNFAPLLVLPLPCKLPEMTCFTQKEVGNTETSSPSSLPQNNQDDRKSRFKDPQILINITDHQPTPRRVARSEFRIGVYTNRGR